MIFLHIHTMYLDPILSPTFSPSNLPQDFTLQLEQQSGGLSAYL